MEKVIRVNIDVFMGQRQYTIYYQNESGEIAEVSLTPGIWGRSSIVDALIRSKYSQDRVEAIINNHFLAIGEWLEKKLAGSDESFIDKEYDDLQKWRIICKSWADEILTEYPETK